MNIILVHNCNDASLEILKCSKDIIILLKTSRKHKLIEISSKLLSRGEVEM